MTRRTALLTAVASAALLLSMSPAQAATSDPAPVTTAPVSTARTTAAFLTAQADARISALTGPRFFAAKPIAAASAKGGMVVDPGTGATLWRYNEAAPLRGASTTKLATAVTTLSVQGTTTRWPTVVVTGRTDREVVLVGGGDPMLTRGQLTTLARQTAAVLATRVPAVPPVAPATPTPVPFWVRVDDTLYAAPTLAPGWPSGYVPGVVSMVSPLKYDLRHTSDNARDAAKYFVAQVGAALTTALASRTDLAPTVTYTGRLAKPVGATEIARFAGNSSGAALRWMLLVSDNDVAEMLFRNNAIARGAAPTWAGARAAEMAELAELGIDTRGFAIYDGSGVGRDDRLTARGLVSLLRQAISPAHPELAPLKGWLPVAGGASGTLAASNGRYTTSPTRCAAGRVFAKTGTLKDAIGLAGYATGSDGKPRVFAVMVARNPAYTPLQTRQAVDRVPTTATGCW